MTHLPEQSGKVRVLFVAADPFPGGKRSQSLLLDEEIREITQKVLATTHRELLTFQQIWATRPNDLLQALNQYKPDIVHFSGHGSYAGELILLDKSGNAHPVSETALEGLFSTLKGNIRVVVLNACFSEAQAKAITKVIDCAIGMNDKIGDEAAIVFASTFYQAIGFGRSVQEAFDQGKVALQLEDIPKHTIPQLLLKKGVNPGHIRLIQNLQEQGRRNKHHQRLKGIESAITRGHYASAYQDLMNLSKETDVEISVPEQARLKYLEALIHLDGKRPSTQVLSVMQRVEELLYSASSLHNLFAYKKILAILKQDFAHTGIQTRKHKEEANKLSRQADRLQMRAEDREILSVFSRSLPQLSRDYTHQLSR